MNHILSPYNFVPVAEKVWRPWELSDISHDHPIKEGYSGTLQLEVEAKTALYTRDGEKDQTGFFRLPDGTFAIPGSGIRGMVRNVVEIVTFSALDRVNDHRYAVRDLRNRELYVDHMANIAATPYGKREPMPLVGAGWFVRAEDYEPGDKKQPWDVVGYIVPCDFAKIEYDFIERHARSVGVSAHAHGNKQSGPSKYSPWKDPNSLDVEVTVAPIRDNYRTGGVHQAAAKQKLLGEYGVVKALGGSAKGRLVFTGQPAPYKKNAGPKRKGAGNPKHHDFVFYNHSTYEKIPVLFKQLQDFEFVHANRGEQNNLGRSTEKNAEWAYWSKERFDNPGVQHLRDPSVKGVPVFYLFEKDRPDTPTLRAFGLAMMFRLAYRNTVRDAIPEEHFRSSNESVRRLDMATALFGYADEPKSNERDQALRSRVSFGTFVASGTVKALPEQRVVLGTPKASYYPNYLEQRNDQHGALPLQSGGRPKYKTFMDDDARIRGWKRYHALDRTVRPPTLTRSSGEELDTAKVETRFCPLPAGTKFTGKVRFHNLRPEELGALLWSLDFGGESSAMHRFGMAKSLGYGSVQFRVGRSDIRDTAEWKPQDPVKTVNSTVSVFEEKADDFCKESFGCTFEETAQIQELIALAKVVAPVDDYRHMMINNGHPNPQQRNEFTLAKSQGLALRSMAARSSDSRRQSGASFRINPRAAKPFRPTIDDIRRKAHIAPMGGKSPVDVGPNGANPTSVAGVPSPLIGKAAPAPITLQGPKPLEFTAADAADVAKCVPANANQTLLVLFNKFTNRSAVGYSKEADRALKDAIMANQTMVDWFKGKGREKPWTREIIKWLGV